VSTPQKGFSLADQMFNLERVSYLAWLFAQSDPGFAAQDFTDQVMARLHDLELKQRISWIAEVLEGNLPQDFTLAADAIHAMLPPPLDPTLTDDDFGSFILSPLSEYVARRGLSAQHLDRSLHLLHALTQRFSVEFSIRPFLNAFPDQVMAALGQWAHDPHYHVRRLVSEGTRPKLPWGMKIGIPVEAPLAYLDHLHADPTRFVTRSVANHLNDITKIEPDLVIDRLRAWQNAGRQDPRELAWMTRHALRGLIKAGHAGAMDFLGYRGDVALSEITFDCVPTQVAIGDSVTLSACLTATEDCAVLVDYVIDKRRADGGVSRKVGKWKELRLKAGQTVTLQKRHRFVKGATTVTYYPGPHNIHLQINGLTRAKCQVDLTA